MKFSYRKGLSTVVTTAIMLTAVAVMGTFVVSWANSNLSTHQQSLQTIYSTSTNKLGEKIIFENVWNSTSPSSPPNPKTINITLNNVGSIGLKVTEIRIDDSSKKKICSWNPSDGEMVPGDSYSNQTNTAIVCTSPLTNPIDVIVTTARGNIFRTQVSP